MTPSVADTRPQAAASPKSTLSSEICSAQREWLPVGVMVSADGVIAPTLPFYDKWDAVVNAGLLLTRCAIA